MFDTSDFFIPGKLSILGDGGAGSSGKGTLASFITKHADNYQFACNAFSAQAGHTIIDDSGRYFYQTMNSCAYQDNYEKLYIGPGAIIELSALFREIDESNIKLSKIGIHPLASIIQDIDSAYERGEIDLNGNDLSDATGTMKYGSTCHGCGAAKARKVLRRDNVLLARDISELSEFTCDVSTEIMHRLDSGQSGLLEIAQGFQLSLNHKFFPFSTSRNCTVAAGFDDMMLPVKYAGNVALNFRTYPIRINSNKYISSDGAHLTQDDIDNGVPHTVYYGDSGPGYDDQQEISWEQITNNSKSPELIRELTSVTKLSRRAFTFSKENLREAILYNQTGHRIFISVNFINYLDHDIFGVSGSAVDALPRDVRQWICDNIADTVNGLGDISKDITIRYLGTGPRTDDKIVVDL